jgi:hypothetical protein
MPAVDRLPMPDNTKAARQSWACTAASSAARTSWPGVRRMGSVFKFSMQKKDLAQMDVT